MELNQTKVVYLVLTGVFVVILCIAVPLWIMASAMAGNSTSSNSTGSGAIIEAGRTGKDLKPRDVIVNVTIYGTNLDAL